MKMSNQAANFKPAYLYLLDSGELQQRVREAYLRLENCQMCAVGCQINRRAGQQGICHTGELARLSSYGPHMGEEKPLRGWRGSGTVFFSGCNLRCQYCQNFDISQTRAGEEIEPRALAGVMLELQNDGCHNINFVSPSHVVPQILTAVLMAAKAGLRLPLVYNTGGFDSVETLRLLDGVVDIYMPDMKYSDPQVARRYSKVKDYPAVNQAAVREMHRQTGDLRLDENGLAQRGLLVRHLVLPNDLAGTKDIVPFLAEGISRDTYLNVMDQYRPAYQAHLFPEINRPVTFKEYQSAVALARQAGLIRLDRK